MGNIPRLLTECENIREMENHLEALQVQLRVVDARLQAGSPKRAELETEGVELNLAILNLQYLMHVRMDILLRAVLLQQPPLKNHFDLCPECERRAQTRVRDIVTDECPACGRSMSRFVKALVAKRERDHAA
jgi:hypothetical protein